jgi:hypothetical protein
MAPVETNREKFVATRRNTAHDLFAQFHRHRATSVRAVGTIMDEDDSNEDQKPTPTIEASFDMFRNVMKTGVLYATSRALLHGFTRLDDPEWANSELTLFALRIVFISFRSYTNIICLLLVGQGAPETGPLPGAPSRDFHMNIEDAELEYASTAGIRELREKVADYYNALYRLVMWYHVFKHN